MKKLRYDRITIFIFTIVLIKVFVNNVVCITPTNIYYNNIFLLYLFIYAILCAFVCHLYDKQIIKIYIKIK